MTVKKFEKTEDYERYAILDGEEFSCLKIQMDRDTISRILKNEYEEVWYFTWKHEN